MQLLLHRIFQQIDDIAVIGHRNRAALIHRFLSQREGFFQRIRNVSHPTLGMAGFDAGSIHLGNDCRRPCHLGSFGLRTAHASQTGRNKQASAQITILRNAQLQTARIQQRIKGAVHNALRTDVHPASGSHLAVVGNAHLHSGVPVLLIIIEPHHQRIGNDDTGRLGLGLEKPQRMSAFDDQCLFARQHFEVLLDEPVLHPVLTDLSRLTIGN